MSDKSISSPEQLRVAAAGLIGEYVRALDTAARSDPATIPFADALRTVATDQLDRGPVERRAFEAQSHLSALAAQPGCDAFRSAGFAAAKVMNWLPVVDGKGIDPVLASGMYAAQAVGTYGCFDSREIAAGLFLIAPGVSYPLHTHAAAEVYWCLGGAITLRHGVDGEPFTLRDGEYSVTPPNRAHALTTAEESVLLAYLWHGDLTAPIWWWDAPEPGSWRRTEWRRAPGMSWQPVRQEPVTPEVMAEAHA